MTPSIELYLLRWTVGALALGALVMTVVVYLVTLDEMNEVYDADLQHVAESVGAFLLSGAGAEGALRPMPVRTDTPKPEEIVTVLWDASGRRLYSSDPRVAIPLQLREGMVQTVVGTEDWLIYTDVAPNGAAAQAAQRVYARRETAAEAASKILPATVVVMVLIAGLLLLALRRGLRPLDTAALDIATRSEHLLTPMQATRAPRELVPLVLAMNGLMARLSQALQAQRRFLGDAAHELRTPVAALRLQLQLLQRLPEGPARQDALDELQSGVARTQRLVEKLLQVARSDPDAEARHPERIALADAVRALVASFNDRAEQATIDLGAHVRAEVSVWIDRQDLDLLVINLIENALRYTPEGGVVDVEVDCVDGRAVLRVIDNGPGIPEAERERVFERFHRGVQAHDQARDGGGSGLGLTIVRGIAERHGAVVRLATARSGRGLEASVVFASVALAPH